MKFIYREELINFNIKDADAGGAVRILPHLHLYRLGQLERPVGTD